MAKGKPWQDDERLVLFRVYCQIPFGRFNRSNREIAAIAAKLGRTPGSLIRKAGNFASMDPAHKARGVGGLPNRSKADEELWGRFLAEPNAIAVEAEEAYERLIGDDLAIEPATRRLNEIDRLRSESDAEARMQMFDGEVRLPPGPTEKLTVQRYRLVQRFFRKTVLASYGYRCALTGLAVPALLNASHIIPWSEDESRRADPRNGIALNVLHDRAFDRGLITFDDEWRMVLSPHLETARTTSAPNTVDRLFVSFEHQRLVLPNRFQPDRVAIRRHRERVIAGWHVASEAHPTRS